MERLLKYCLSFLIIAAFFSCEKGASKLTLKERRAEAEKVFSAGSHLPQGSPKSMTRIQDAINIDPTFEPAVYALSVAYLKRGMPHKWKPQYDKAVKLDSVTRIPWRGYLYLWFYRDYKKAIADFDASDTLTPNFIDAPQGHSVDYWRGIAYLGLRNYEKSNWYFEKHIAKETEDFGEDYVDLTAFLYNGIAYYETGNFEKAHRNFDKQLQYSRNLSADAKYYKALILKEENKTEEAKKLVNSAISDFKTGYFNSRPYVETLRQIYIEDLENLKAELHK